MIIVICSTTAFSRYKSREFNRIYSIDYCRKEKAYDNETKLEKVKNSKIGINTTNCMTCPQADIIVSTTQSWVNQTINLCPGQRIWIQPNVILTISRCTLKIDPSQSTGLWEGILVQSGSKLLVQNNSVIRDCKQAIRGLNGFTQINVTNSTITNVSSAIYGIGTGNFIGIPIYLYNCVLQNRSSSYPLMVGANGVNLYMVKTQINNLSSNNISVGVDGFNNSVTLLNCQVLAFNRCINKGVGGNIQHSGLDIRNSDIIDGYSSTFQTGSLHNSDISVRSYNCIFGGRVDNSGKSLGSWERNYFYSDLDNFVSIGNPELSHVFYENGFKSTLQLLGSHPLTDAECNRWENSGYAVDGIASSIKNSWGSHNEASGNSHSNGILPVLNLIAGNDIINYQFDFGNYIFSYQNQFKKIITSGDRGCQQRWRGIAQAAEDGDFPTYDDNYNNNLWTTNYQLYQSAQSQFSNADSTTQVELKNQMEDAQVAMGQSVLESILNSNNGISDSSLNVWASRADPLLTIRGHAMNLFVSDSFTELSSYLNSLSLTGLDSDDRNVFKNAVVWMKQAKDADKNLLELDSTDLNTLCNYANSSFGNYTAILRGWISINYFIYFTQPPINNNLVGNPKHMESQIAFDSSIKLFSHDDCITIIDNLNSNIKVNLEIYSVDGFKVYNTTMHSNETKCLNHKLIKGVYKLILSGINLKKPVIQSLIIQ